MADNTNKNNDKNDKKNEIEKLLKEINDKNISEADLNEIKSSLEKIISDESRGSLVLRFFKRLLMLIVSIYVISTAVLGFLINSVSLENIYYIPLVSLGITLIFTIIKLIPALNKNPLVYVTPYIIIMIIGCLLNDKFNVFDFSIMWVIYIFLIEFLYSIFTLCRMRKKYSFLRR